MNKWIENRIEELTDQRRSELQEFYEEQWRYNDQEVDEEKQSLEYSEEIIPNAIENLMYEDGWDENYIEALQDINFHNPLWHLQGHWDEIEGKYPQYIEKIKSFFKPFIVEYNEQMKAAESDYISSAVEYALEQEVDLLRDQAQQEYDEMNEGGEAD